MKVKRIDMKNIYSFYLHHYIKKIKSTSRNVSALKTNTALRIQILGHNNNS